MSQKNLFFILFISILIGGIFCYFKYFYILEKPPIKTINPKDHISTTINDTAENIVKDFPNAKCDSDSDCKGVYGTIEAVCLKCPNMKMALGTRVFVAPIYGFCEQSHKLESRVYEDYFYKKGQMSTYFCIADFNGFEVPTISSNIERYWGVWKDFVMQSQGISNRYFDEHISLLSADELKHNNGEVFFNVYYLFNFDWVEIKLGDGFLVKKIGDTNFLTEKEILSISENEGGLMGRKTLSLIRENVKTLREMNSVISEKNAENILKQKCNKSITANQTVLTREGRLVLNGWATISDEENKCIFGRVDLETGKITECHEAGCRVY